MQNHAEYLADLLKAKIGPYDIYTPRSWLE